MIVSVHQPNFCPYSGFFEKVRKADLFVIMSHCQFEKGGYQSRFNHNGWHTMSVNRGLIPLHEKKYINYDEDWTRIVNKYPNLQVFDDCIGEDLVETNTSIIVKACEILGIDTMIVTDFPTKKTGTERLVEICKHYRATKYLSGPSGRNYLNQDLFKEIELEFFDPKDRRSLVELI